MKFELSRRAALRWLGMGSVALFGARELAAKSAAAAIARRPETTVLAGALSATLKWSYSNIPRHALLKIATRDDMSSVIASAKLADDEHAYRLAVAPDTDYYWTLSYPGSGEQPLTGRFRTAKPRLDDTADDAVRYRNPRVGAHWSGGEQVVPFAASEPLAPWFDRKGYLGPAAPRFDETIKSRLPTPVMENADAELNLYWYCWKTFFDVWFFSPTAADHQAVSNLLGLRSWGEWGSTMVWDTGFMLHFARYGHGVYPFITGLDNCYARQHENGFICRESDAQNREVYFTYPVNPPIFAWAEWEYFQISGDLERLKRVLTPIVKHYEWWVTYQRRRNGWYWNTGMGEGMDDSPRNALAYYTMSAAAEQALAALALSRIARACAREDLAAFFAAEHAALGQLINDSFWDARHQIYNDRTHDGQFITELEPGQLCKHAFIFWPLMAEVADSRGVAGLVAEIANPASFNRSSGIASLSADSRDYREDGQYWKGAVWPPIQCIVQEGLRANGHEKLARELAGRYLEALVKAFEQDQTVTENLAPDSPKGHGAREFVGWGGIGPIANLIEYVLGFQVKAPEQIIEWRIGRTDRHGILNLSMGKDTMSLICARRERESAACHIEVQSSGDFTLKVLLGDRSSVHRITAGRTEMKVEPGPAA